MGAKLTRTGKDVLASRLKAFQKACSARVVVAGYPEGKVSDFAAQKAYWNEHGKNGPARPFMTRAGMYMLRGDFYKPSLWLLSVTRPAVVEMFLEKAGEGMAGEVRHSIADQGFAPLADSTKRRKGHDVQLMETTEMYYAATSAVKERT